MNFRSAKKKKEKKKRGSLFTLVVIFVALGFTGVYYILSVGLSSLAKPFWQFSQGSTSSLSFVFKDKKVLEKKITSLEDEITTLKIQSLTNEIFRQENLHLKGVEKELGNKDAIIASILVKPNHTLYKTLIVDKGAEDNVKKGDLVLGYGAVAIGKISDVRKNISYIELFTQNGIPSILVHISSSVYVDAVGHGGSTLTFSLPRNVDVLVGDLVSLPRSQGILFGTVEEIQFDSTDPVQTIYARSAVNINELSFVEIINSYEEHF